MYILNHGENLCDRELAKFWFLFVFVLFFEGGRCGQKAQIIGEKNSKIGFHQNLKLLLFEIIVKEMQATD